MSSLLVFILIGLTSGALVGLIALSVVVTYRATKVVNFSVSAMGSLSAYCCYTLISLGVPIWLALLAAITSGMALGALTFMALWLLRKSSVLVQFMATLGLFTAAQSVTLLVFGPLLTVPESLLPTTGIALSGGLSIGVDRLLLLVAALLASALLSLIYRRTLFGLATSAVAESPLFIASSGWSTARIQLINFLASGALTSLAIVFLAPVVGLSGPTLAALILPALAAALAGRFSSYGWTVAAALLIGVTQSLVSLYSNDLAGLLGVSPLSISALPNAVPLVLIVLLTIARGRARLQRGEHQAGLPGLGDGKVPVIPAVLGVLAVVWVLSLGDAGWAQALIATFAGGIIVLSTVVVTGFGGQFSLCQFALAGFAGWAAARFASATGAGFLLALAGGVIAAMALGFVIAQAAKRARGMVLAVATLGVALLLNVLIFNNSSVTGGFSGITVATPALFGYSLDPIGHPERYAYFGLVLFLFCAMIAANVRRGRMGLRLLAVRSDELAAAALGVNVAATKTYAFVVAAALAGLAGGYLTFQFPHTEFTQYDSVSSITYVQFAVLGGLGWVGSAFAGGIGTTGALLSYATNVALGGIQAINTWFALVSGVVIVLALRMTPDGIVSVWAAGFNRPEAEQERVRLELPVSLFRWLGGLEVTVAACVLIGIFAYRWEWIGIAAAGLLCGAVLVRSILPRQRPRSAASVRPALIVLGVCAADAASLLFDASLGVFFFGQVLAVMLFTRGSARLSRRWMNRLRWPRPGQVAPLAARLRTPLALEVQELTVRFGGVVAVDRVSFEVRPGEIVGLIGPNGAGKTTALDAITGFAPVADGQVLLGGRTATRWTPEQVARAGVIRSWQSVGLFSAMSARENLLVAADPHGSSSYLLDLVHPGVMPSTAIIDEVVKEFELGPWLDSGREVLPQGIGRLVGIARALSAEPAFLLLDEPTAGLDAAEASEIFRTVRRIAQRTGIGILLVEHDVPLMTRLCDRLVVLDFGRKIADGTPDAVMNDPLVVSAYFGSKTASAALHDAVGQAT
jgi:sulfate-transporting ATPase